MLNVKYVYPTIAIRLPYDLRYNADMTNELKPVETVRTKVLKNGAVYDMESKRIVAGAKTSLITAENAREMQSKAIAKKREAVMRAANREVDPALIAEFGEYAFIAEGAMNMQRLASDPASGKAGVMAWESLQRAAGLAETKGEDAPQATVNHVHTLSDAVLGLLSGLAGADGFDNSNYQNRSDVVDGQAVDAGQADTAGE